MCPLPLEYPSHLLPHPTPLACHRAPALGSLHRTSNEYNTTKLMGCHFLDDITKDCGFYLGWWVLLLPRFEGSWMPACEFPFSVTRGLHRKEHVGP